MVTVGPIEPGSADSGWAEEGAGGGSPFVFDPFTDSLTRAFCVTKSPFFIESVVKNRNILPTALLYYTIKLEERIYSCDSLVIKGEETLPRHNYAN